MKQLTTRQQQIYDFIKECIEIKGIPPTRVEISKQFGFKSANAAEEHLRALAKKGAIEIIAGTSRGLRLLLEEANDPGLPLVGLVAAGAPILAQEHVESHYQVDPNLFKPYADFLLRVNGMSMQDIGIMDGDLLAVHQTKHFENGQVVVARIDDEVTVKRIKHLDDTVILQAENENFNDIVIDLKTQNFTIEGLAVGIIRNSDWM